MNISPIIIKKALDQYDQTPSLQETTRLIVKYTEDTKIYENIYANRPDVDGVYVLTGQALYFGQGEWIRLSSRYLVTDSEETLSVIRSNMIASVEPFREPMYHYCPDKDEVIRQLNKFYMSLSNADHRNELSLEALHDFYNIILTDPWNLSKSSRTIILHLISEILMNCDKPGKYAYGYTGKLKDVFDHHYINFVKIIHCLEKNSEMDFVHSDSNDGNVIQFKANAYQLLTNINCDITDDEFEFSLKHIEFLSEFGRYTLYIHAIKKIANHKDIKNLERFIRCTNNLNLSFENDINLNKIISHPSIDVLMDYLETLIREDKDIPKIIFRSFYPQFITCNDPVSLMEYLIFFYNNKHEIGIHYRGDEFNGDMLVSHKSIIYQLYDIKIFNRKIFEILMEINNPIKTESNISLLLRHCTEEQYPLLIDNFEHLIKSNSPIELFDLVHSMHQLEEMDVSKIIFRERHTDFMTCNDPASIMELYSFFHNKQSEVNIIDSSDNFRCDMIVSHKSIIYQLYEHGILTRNIYLLLMKVNDPVKSEKNIFLLLDHCVKEQYPLLIDYLEPLMVSNVPIELFDFIQTIRQLNASIIHKGIIDDDNIKSCLDLCNLLHSSNLLEQKYFDLIIKFYQKSDITIESVFKEILLDGLSRFFYQTIPLTTSYSALFHSIKNVDLSDQAFITEFESYQDLAHEQLLEKLIENCISEKKSESIFPLEFSTLASQMSNHHLLSLFNKAVYAANQSKSNQFMHYFTHLTDMEIYDSGKSTENWWQLTKHFLLRLPPRQVKSSYIDTMQKVKLPLFINTLNRFQKLLIPQYGTFLRLQGRTILLQNNKKDVLSIKVKKSGEAPEELYREYQATLVMKNKALEYGLLGQFANPVGVVELSKRILRKLIALNQEEFEKSDFYSLTDFDKNNNYTVYLYQVPDASQGYHIYLHDTQISQREYAKSNEIVAANLSKLLRQGVIFDRLADIFHNVSGDNLSQNNNRPDLGRYIVLANLLAPTQFRSNEKSGSGRLTAWHKAIQYPNLRLNYLADVGDCISLSDIQLEGDWCKRYFSFLHLEYGDKASNFIYGNFIAEYIYVLMLIAGYRAYLLAQDKHDQSTTAIWEAAAQQVFENSIIMAYHLTHKSENEIRNILSKVCNQTMLARQMQFWMSNEYINHVKDNRIPTDVYGDDVNVTIDIHRFRRGTFNEQIGYSINGVDADLGTVNGQEPIKEANKLMYWTVTLIAASSLEFDLILKDILAIISERDMQQSEAIRQNAFDYISTPYKDKIQAAICEIKSEKAVNQEQSSYYHAAANNHKLLYHARSIQCFWRKKLERVKEERVLTNKDMNGFRVQV